MKDIPLVQLLKGIISYIPYSYLAYKKAKGDSSHSCSNPRFCYSLWLRILVTLHNYKCLDRLNNIAEFGNSSSFGVGLAALLTGVERYSALEVVKYEMKEKNILMFENLIQLFRNKEDIPDEKEFPSINLKLDSYKFPEEILTERKLIEMLSEERLSLIRTAILNCDHIEKDGIINYYVPWVCSLDEITNSFDFIFSRAVMEHIDHCIDTYNQLYVMLKPEGIMLHDIEYHNHNIGNHWNSHWCYSDFLWKLIKGKRPFITNRLTHSMHERILENMGYKIILNNRTIRDSKIPREKLSRKFENISDTDFVTYGGCLLIKKL
jgi:hypothetical protein